MYFLLLGERERFEPWSRAFVLLWAILCTEVWRFCALLREWAKEWVKRGNGYGLNYVQMGKGMD